MNWDSLLESFGRISTESNSTDDSFEDMSKGDPLPSDSVDITDLLFDTSPASESVKMTDTRNLAEDGFDLSSLDVNMPPFVIENENTPKKEAAEAAENAWVDVSALQSIENVVTPPADLPKKSEDVKPKAMQLALANEIEVQAPWVDVSALAASISETPVFIQEKTPQSIFTMATFVPTHMQSYIDLNPDVSTVNTLSQSSFDLATPEIIDVRDKVFVDSKLISDSKTGIIEEDTKFLEAPAETENDNDRSLNTPPPSKVQQKIEINPSSSVMFNSELTLEDTLLFDSEPPSDMYIVKTENIFGKEIAKRNALEQLAADAGICSCTDCKCDPSGGECRSCVDKTEEVKEQGCGEDKCSCVDCKCDHAAMKCAVGCGRATDTNQNTFLHYHRRHNNSNLEELGVFTQDSDGEETSKEVVESLRCSCPSHDESNSSRAGTTKDEQSQSTKGSCCKGKSTKGCCVTICFKKLDAFKALLADNNLLHALRAHNITTTS